MNMIRKDAAGEVTAGVDFVMSDATVDRMGDIIEPDGWDLRTFKRNPIALFSHDSTLPIGTWENVRVEGGKLLGKLKLAKRGTSQRIDELISLAEQKILRAVSVGFIPKEAEPIDKEKPYAGKRFKKQELLETSLVAVPANPAALSMARSLGISQSTMTLAFGVQAETRRDVTTPPGGHAFTTPILKRALPMKTLSQRIEDAQGDLNAKRDKLTELMSADELDNDAVEELNAQIEKAERTLANLKAAEVKLATDASAKLPAVVDGQARRPLGTVAPKLEPGALVMRAIVAKVIAHVTKRNPLDVLIERYGSDGQIDDQSKAVFAVVTRAATAPADTTTSGWASQLVETQNAEFMQLLLPAAVYPGLSARGLRLNFGRSGIISIPTRAATPTIAGAFVLQGNPIPVKQGAFSAVTLSPKKMGVISTFTREIAEHSTPAIEGLIRNAMQEDTSVALDAVLLDATAASATRPAGIRNGVSVTTATAGGGFAALVGDVKNLVGALVTGTNGNIRAPVWIMNPIQALAITLTQNAGGDFPFASEVNQNRFQGYPLIVSSTVTAGMVILVDAADFVSVEGDAPRFDVSDQATLHMEDTTPLAIGTPGAPATVAAPTRSLWQTDTLGIRMLMDVNWAFRRTGGVAWTQAVTW